MRSIRSWRGSTWLIVLWSGLWAFVGAFAILAMATTACVARTDNATPICQDWAHFVFAWALYLVILVWLVGLSALVVVWAITRPNGGQGRPGQSTRHKGAPRGACAACGTEIDDVREACPHCGYSSQEGYDGWR